MHTRDRYIRQIVRVQHAVGDIEQPQRKHSIIHTLVHADTAGEQSVAVDLFFLSKLL